MKIILLSGKPHSGKTGTLNKLYDELISDKYSVICPKEPVGGDPRDFECVLQQPGKKKTVAFYTMGDILWLCHEAIIKYAGTDVLILAYSDKFSDALNVTIKQYDPHVVIEKTTPPDADCEKLIKDIKGEI